jgi:hypothetical protein
MEVTDKQRDMIERKLAESRRLGKEADAAGRRVVAALHRAARSPRRGAADQADVRRQA